MKTSNSADQGCLTWLHENVAKPAECAFVQNAYEPVRTVVNAASKAAIGQTVLPDLQVTLASAIPGKEFSPEYFAQLGASSVVSVACYATAAQMTGGVMRGCASAARWEGTAARLMASQSTAQILGGAIHDGLMAAPDNATRLGHAAMGAVAMGAFAGTNRYCQGENFVNRYGALALTGAAVGAGEAGASQLMAGEPLSWSQIRSAATASATVSVLLPGAQWGLKRIIDAGNVQIGRGMPLHRYGNYHKLPGQSAQLDGLMHDYPLVRVQPEQSSGSHIEHKKSLVHLGDRSGATDLAHELGHLRAVGAVEPEFLTAASVLKTNEELAKSMFVQARLKQETIARAIEQRTAYDITGRLGAAHDADFEYSDYRRLFSAEFEKFKTTAGAYRPERDFALLGSAEVQRLRQEDVPRNTIEALYGELLTASEKNALIQAIEHWQADEGKQQNAFDLTWGLKSTGWRKALMASIGEECAAKIYFSKELNYEDLPDPLVGSLSRKLSAQLAEAVEELHAAEQLHFQARRAAFAEAGREHEFWEKEYQTVNQHYLAADDIARPRNLRAENQIMAGWDALYHACLNSHDRAVAEDKLFDDQERVEQKYKDALFPYKQQRTVLINRLASAGYDLEDLNPYVFESAATHPVNFDEAPWRQAQARFGKTFNDAVNKSSENMESFDLLLDEVTLPPHVVRKALTSALLYGKDPYRWWQDRAFWRNGAPVEIPLASTADLHGLGAFITKHRQSADDHLVQRLAQLWPKMEASERSQLSAAKLSQAIAVAAKYVYPHAKNQGLAREAFQWGLSGQAYNECERIMHEAAIVPDAFPTDRSWTVGNLRGHFLPRTDPRILFLGEHTNSCIKLGGANEDGLKWTLQSPIGGFFAVEDVKTGALVAASRVWKVPQFSGVTFNNVESKGLGSRDEDVLSIYRSAAKHLIGSGDAKVVTMGVGHNDVRIDNLDELDFGLPLPKNYEGLNDSAVQQVLLAGRPEQELYELAARPKKADLRNDPGLYDAGYVFGQVLRQRDLASDLTVHQI